MGEIVHGFEERRHEQLTIGTKKELADRALLLQQLEWWAEKEADAYRAYEYAKDKREDVARRLGLFVMPGRVNHNVPPETPDGFTP